jgi:hypothetical protein
VIEVNDGQDDAEFVAKLEQQAKKANRIGTSGNGDSQAIAGFQQVQPPHVIEYLLCEGMHGNMLQLRGNSRLRLSGQEQDEPRGGRRPRLPGGAKLRSLQCFELKGFAP